jgi:hypothetical protein
VDDSDHYPECVMAAGPSPLAFAYFVGVKAAGYSAAAMALRKLYGVSSTQPSPLRVGLVRAAIGTLVGVSYGAVWLWLGTEVGSSIRAALFYAFLVPIRFLEWGCLLKLFFDRPLVRRGLLWKVAIGGTAWSFCLDVVGVAAAWVLPGGFWVC